MQRKKGGVLIQEQIITGHLCQENKSLSEVANGSFLAFAPASLNNFVM
jgi:hypothetical protein